jgi:hypothetical protein
MPFCTLLQALTAAGSEAVIILHEMNDEYLESSVISKSVAIFAAPGEEPIIRGNSGTPALTVSSSGVLFLRGVLLANTANAGGFGLLVSQGSAWVEQSRIVNNTGGGIVVDGGGMLVLENSFVGGNATDVAALDVVDGAADVVYSTLVAGLKLDVDPTALSCAGGVEVSVRNSILVSPAVEPAVQCSQASIASSILEDASGFPGNAEAVFMPAWFVGYAAGDFHLAPNMFPMVIETAATWQLGDPTVDIDGDARPSTDASPDFAGADAIP